MNIDYLNKNFSIGNKLRFINHDSGITLIKVDTAQATASISLLGGSVLTWHPKSQREPVLWESTLAKYVPGTAIRAGVPICWPWFGAHEADSQRPGHGFARLVPWKVVSTNIDNTGVVEIELILDDSELATKLRPSDWPKTVSLSVRFRIGEKLEIALVTTNNSERLIRFTEGLHTYFNVSNISSIAVLGLDGCEYVDLINGNLKCKQSGAIKFDGELGRIFVNCMNTTAIEDRKFGRVIQVMGQGSQSIAVWNPWLETASKMPDLGREGWRTMVCVETANALENTILVQPNQQHTMKATYAAYSIG